ncbi:MAG: PAS domain S-box protein [Pirellulaceae bacterium]|nr:PAS domain S-box protein [Pirellulaceae bacterium]
MSQKGRWSDGIGIYVYGPVPRGQIIIDLAKDSPAARAGLQVGDQIVGVNGEDRLTVFQRELHAEPGSEIQLSVSRRGVEENRTVTLTAETAGTDDLQIFRPYRIAQGPDQTMWFATRAGKIISMIGRPGESLQWTHHTDDHDLPRVAVPSMTATPDGVAAVSRNTNTSALVQFDGRRWSTIDLQRAIQSSICSLRNGDLLVGSNGALVTIHDGIAQTRSTQEFEIFGNDILVTQTTDGAVWVAGKGATALRVEQQGGRWTSYDGILYQDSDARGKQWFLSNRKSVICRDGDSWREFDQSDGLMSLPMAVVAARSGEVWAAGSHRGIAATCRLSEGRWSLKEHPRLSWTVDRRAVLEDRDGRMWFGAATVGKGNDEMLGGVVRFDGDQWKHFLPTNRLTFTYGAAQTRDGSVWFGGPVLVQIQPNDKFGDLKSVPGKAHGYCDAVASDQDGNLWVGTRNYGLMRMDGELSSESPPIWFDENDGLSGNRIRNVLPINDGTVLVHTPAGFDRYDGKNWNRTAFSTDLAKLADYHGLRQSPDNAIWINGSPLGKISAKQAAAESMNHEKPGLFQTHRYLPDRAAPDTRLESEVSQIPVGDDALFAWTGIAAWDRTPAKELTYSWRLNDQPWSPFTKQTLAKFSGLDAGEYQLQVRARDRDFNIDQSPALAKFRVIPALWQRAWFQALLGFSMLTLSLVIVQSARVYRRESSLRSTNEKLTVAERQLQNSNAALEDRVSERTNELNASNEHLRREIQERIAAESRATASEIRYRSIVEDQTEYIVRFNADAEIEFVNEAFLRANGQSLPGNGQFADALPKPVIQRVQTSVTNLTTQMPTRSHMVRVEHPTGSQRWEEWRGRVLLDDQDRILGYQAIGRDVTELKQAESQLQEKERQLAHIARVSALGEMVAGISHEINQPLATIANFSAASQVLLDNDLDFSENRQQLRDWAARIAEQTHRIGDIIKGLRRFGRPGSKYQTFDICDAISESLLLTESRTREIVDDVTTQCCQTLPRVTADKIQIEQVLVNLIRNACDAMEDHSMGQRELLIEAEASENVICVTVTDSGPGVDPSALDHLFDPFVTTKADGMGIGLAISRSIIESHHGKLNVIADAGCGKFQFTLPIDPA